MLQCEWRFSKHALHAEEPQCAKACGGSEWAAGKAAPKSFGPTSLSWLTLRFFCW